MHAVTELNLYSPDTTPAEVEKTFLGVKLSDLPTIIAFFLIHYIMQPYPFQLAEYAIQHLNDLFKDFPDVFFESLATGEIMCTDSTQKINFYNFIMEVMEMNLFPKEDWKIRLEPETLKEIKLITDCALFNRKSVRQNTALVYKQVKFNLLRESSAGYSFLLVKLSGAIKNLVSYEEINEIVSFHIGSFNLELVRVVEFIIQLFELNVETQYNYFLGLLSNCPWFEPNGQDDQKSGVLLYSSILGFRFANSLGESPEKLCHVAALMVKHNLAKLELFYPQLGPSLEEWQAIFSRHVTGLKTRARPEAVLTNKFGTESGGNESRAKQGESSSLSKNNTKDEEPIEYQRISLLKALLSIGAYRDSLWILLRQPDFLGFDSDCALLTCRLISELLDFHGEYHSKCFAPLSIVGLNEPSAAPIKRKNPVLKALFPHPDQVFYYTEWKEEIDAELADQVFDWIKLLGPNVLDSKLFAHLASLAKEPLKASKTSAEYLRWSEILRYSLFPSLTISGGTEGSHNILWDTLSGLPVAERYSFYDEWNNGKGMDTVELQAIKLSSIKIFKQIANRITVVNARQFSVSLKSEILRCPGAIFLAILKSVCFYNRYEQYIEVFRYLSKLTADMFQYVALDLVSDPANRGLIQSERLKPDCLFAEGWLKSIAGFMGCLCRKYSILSMNTIVTYVANQLSDGNLHDVVFLSELLIKLGYFEPHENLGNLPALTGGRALRTEVHPYPSEVAFSPSHAASLRLAEAVVKTRLLPLLIVLLARYQQSISYDYDVGPYMPDADITDRTIPGLTAGFVRASKGLLSTPKVLASHVDTFHDVTLRLIELLSILPEPFQYSDYLPSFTAFCKDYEVDYPLVFAFLRPHLATLVSRDMGELQTAAEEMEQGELKEDTEVAEPPKDIWLPSLQALANEFHQLYPHLTCGGISAEFYITFWQLSNYEICVPEAEYKQQITRLKNTPINGRSTEAAEARKSINKRIDALEKEQAKQQAIHLLCLQRISREKSHWFAPGTDPKALVTILVENCILQRCIVSGLDAMFCAKFLIMLHTQKTPGFSLVLAIDHIMEYFRKMLFFCTPKEARHFGQFITELFAPLNRWNANATEFESETSSLFSETSPTCISRAQHILKENSSKLEGQNLSSHDIFQFQMLNWNRQIFDAIFPCLESADYMQIHAAFTILAQVKDTYPLTKEHIVALLQQVEVLVLDPEVKMNSIALSYKCIVHIDEIVERCVPFAAFSRIHAIIFRPRPEARPAPEEARAAPVASPYSPLYKCAVKQT
ncbi:THO2 plays a role in transcriptional elongation [Entomophthora muscae]|uniref:THO2 plays a role in transcriptional elongation n=1 Tax=Entomophthora muscae TaxID=34485 RepID=A0ACC2U867_9FUNG|nr:THO2 plays a role in transcriptional elongation [Entomophthora muscae]